jgi:hypothetical protein
MPDDAFEVVNVLGGHRDMMTWFRDNPASGK